MNLPEELTHAIEKELANTKLNALSKFTKDLSDRYRSNEKNASFMSSDGHRLSYLAFRMPATFAAIVRVLSEVRARVDIELGSFLDVGSGPGTALWAAREVFPAFSKATLLEKDRSMQEIARRLVSYGNFGALEWKREDLLTSTVEKHDLIIASYALGEMPGFEKILEKLWNATGKLLVILEPGTPVGFSRIRLMREKLIAFGGHIVAPCPHQENCPLKESDWCHFDQRLERSSQHRKIKGGELGYEDEKFSYLVFAKEPVPASGSRVLRHPQKNPGFVNLTLCTIDGIKSQVVSRKDKELYSIARKVKWGDQFP